MNFFITGGSRGIGESIVLDALRAGHNVAFTYVQQEERAMEQVAQYQKQFPDRRCMAYHLDVRQSSNVDDVGEQVLADFGSIEVVVANAGVNTGSLLISLEDDEWNQVLDTNLTGAFYVCRFFLPQMLSNRYGRILVMSSITSNGGSGMAAYCASKAGLLGMVRAIAKEYGRRGITANAVSPGHIDTDMTRELVPEQGREFWDRYCPVGRSGTPEEVSKVVLFLASEAASFINGADIAISGGLDWIP